MRFSARLLSALPVLAVLAIPSIAHADDKNCAPGDWFCGDTQPPSKDGALQPLPSSAEEKAEPARRAGTPPPVVVYQPPPTVVVQPREAPPPYYYVPRAAAKRSEWGLNLHVGGLFMGKGQDDNAGMGQLGFGLRYRPIPYFAVEADLDFAGGRDYNGYRRNETAFTLDALVFLNPKSKTQVYLVGGVGWSGAKAIDDRSGHDDVEYHYGYFGVLGGVGLEFRLSKVVALNVDLRGFIRGRIDDNRHDYYEFTDASGRHTNTSGGGSLNGGLTFYW